MSLVHLTEHFFRNKHRQASNTYLSGIHSNLEKYKLTVDRILDNLNLKSGNCLNMGTTFWKKDILIPLFQILDSHGLILGATGSGKSYYALNLLIQALQQTNNKIGFGILDPKGELFHKALDYIVAFILQLDPNEQEQIRQRLYIFDFSNKNNITPYNFLTLRRGEDLDFLLNNRLDSLCELFSGSSVMTSRMRLMLKYFLLLLARHNLPITLFDRICDDKPLLSKLAHMTNDNRLVRYFDVKFRNESKATITALRHRLDALFNSQIIKYSVSTETSMDFRKLQDDGAIVLINTSGSGISRHTSLLLQTLILSDIRQSVFHRKSRDSFIWFIDEAQWLYKHASSRNNMNELLSMSRSFGSFFWLLTQSLSSAIHDSEIRNAIECNVKNVLLLRSTLKDAKILHTALPSTGGYTTQATNFTPQKYLTPSEEIKTRLEEIPRFPDRIGYLWLKAHLSKAVKIKTPFVPNPQKQFNINNKSIRDYCSVLLKQSSISVSQIRSQVLQKEKWLDSLSEPTPTSKPHVKNKDNTDTNDLMDILEKDFNKKQDKS